MLSTSHLRREAASLGDSLALLKKSHRGDEGFPLASGTAPHARPTATAGVPVGWPTLAGGCHGARRARGHRGAAPPASTNIPRLCCLSGKIFVDLRQGFLKASAFSPVNFLQETDGYENKTPNQSKYLRPTPSVFLPRHPQKAHMCSGARYFRWLWQKESPSVFQTRCLFTWRLAAALGNRRRCTGPPAGKADVALWPQNASLHPKPLGAGRKRRPRVSTVVFPQDPPSRVEDCWLFVRPL